MTNTLIPEQELPQSEFFLISEQFESIQGEGRSVGELAYFLRLGTCNLSCSWCDTKYSWDWSKYDPKDLYRTHYHEVAQQILAYKASLIVITGGEPLIQQDKIVKLVAKVGMQKRFEIETNGTIIPNSELVREWPNVSFNVSPKLKNAGMKWYSPLDFEALSHFSMLQESSKRRVTFKFVVEHPDEFAEIDQILEKFTINKSDVFIMPQSTTMTEHNLRIKLLIDATVDAGFNLSPRLHLIAFDGERGR